MLSDRAFILKPSPLQDFFRKINEADGDIISLGAGEPYNKAPLAAKSCAIRGIELNKIKYTATDGMLPLKEKIAEKYNVSINNVVVSNGAKTILGSLFWTLLNEGDQVLVPTPYYPPFFQGIQYCGADPILISTKHRGFKLTADDIECAINRLDINPKFLIINTPNNPTGVVYDYEELVKIAELSRRYNFIVISDECYSNFQENIDFTYRSIDENAIIINSVSKNFAMSGWRIGWAVCSKEVARYLKLYLENFVGCPSKISQRAAFAVLKSKFVGIRDYSDQRELIQNFLRSNSIPFGESSSGFYVFANFEQFMKKNNITGSISLANYFLKEARVALIPGVAFGGDFDTYLRISLSARNVDINKAIKRLSEAIE